MKIEKISTTQYMPTQNRKGCREPIMSCLLELAMEIGFWFLMDIGQTVYLITCIESK